jgi:excisionase family DNA binding protein
LGAPLELKVGPRSWSSERAYLPIQKDDLGGLIAIAARRNPGTLEELVARLGRVDRDGALAAVDRAVAAGATLDEIVTGLLAPAQVDMGRRWAEGELGAADAQAVAAIVRVALARAAPPANPTDHQPVVVACPEGEHHELPAEMVTELLRARGWPATLIAGAVPAADLRRYLRSHRPAALLLSCTTARGLPGAARVIDAAHDSGVGVIAGGAAFGADDRRAMRLGAAAWSPTVEAAIQVLERWEAEAPRLPVGRALSDEYQRFEAQLPQVRAAALATLGRTNLRRSDDIAGLVALQDRLDLLLAHLGAAVLVDEGRLFADHVTQQLAFWRARGIAGGQLLLAVDAVGQSLAGGSELVRRILDDGYRSLGKRARAPVARPPAGPTAGETTAFAVGSMAGPDVAHGQVFADLLFLAAMSCHAPFALISVAQADGQWSTLSYGVDRRGETLEDRALFAAVAASPEPIEIHDLARHDPLGAGSLATGPLAVRFVYGIPLSSPRGSTIGVLCLLDRRTREMDGRERQAMLAVARQVCGQLVQWRRSGGARSRGAPSGGAPSGGAPSGGAPSGGAPSGGAPSGGAPSGGARSVGAAARPSDSHPANGRRTHPRRGPDAAREDLLGRRRAGADVDPHLLRSREVAVLFDVTERTVINWAASDKLASLRTGGGHLRFRSEDVLALLDKPATSAGRRPTPLRWGGWGGWARACHRST